MIFVRNIRVCNAFENEMKYSSCVIFDFYEPQQQLKPKLQEIKHTKKIKFEAKRLLHMHVQLYLISNKIFGFKFLIKNMNAQRLCVVLLVKRKL